MGQSLGFTWSAEYRNVLLTNGVMGNRERLATEYLVDRAAGSRSSVAARESPGVACKPFDDMFAGVHGRQNGQAFTCL